MPSLPPNTFKAAIASGTEQIGLWSSLCSNIATEIIAGSGFDWIVLDTEHAPNEVPGLLSQLQAMHGSPTEPVVRVAWNDTVIIKRVLDIGARTLLIPFVQNAEEARAAVAATRYPPRGVRGVSVGPRANRYGRVPGYHHTAHESICVIVQIETRSACSQIEAIAAVEGIDGIFIGPSDLAADLGHLANPKHPEVQAAIADACKRIRAAGKGAGMLTGDPEEACRYLANGFTFVAMGSDAGVLAGATAKLAAMGREQIAQLNRSTQK
ncbi:MAG TPA: HpcH/HpaI aldolase/citrate lyase family protein [Bryobacteraceae bacterium]|jgi:4-hydroxy-2-oxoheptanedioate aldolase